MNLTPPPLDSRAFAVDKTRRMLIAEHSDLDWCNILHPIYDDACDSGIAIRNAKTGNVTRWYMIEQNIDRENELTVSIYRPCPNDGAANVAATAGWTVHILND